VNRVCDDGELATVGLMLPGRKASPEELNQTNEGRDVGGKERKERRY
jgi:hypothetical protein